VHASIRATAPRLVLCADSEDTNGQSNQQCCDYAMPHRFTLPPVTKNGGDTGSERNFGTESPDFVFLLCKTICPTVMKCQPQCSAPVAVGWSSALATSKKTTLGDCSMFLLAQLASRRVSA